MRRTTDLLFGVVSLNRDNTHKFFCDIDDDRLSRDALCFLASKFGYVCVISSGRGFHLANFSVHLSLDELIELNKLLGADEKYIEWIKKVGYAVLRISRRSSHFKIPKLEGIVISRDLSFNEIVDIATYKFLLNLENKIDYIYKVIVDDGKNEKI
jgi:hypothetical protein